MDNEGEPIRAKPIMVFAPKSLVDFIRYSTTTRFKKIMHNRKYRKRAKMKARKEYAIRSQYPNSYFTKMKDILLLRGKSSSLETYFLARKLNIERIQQEVRRTMLEREEPEWFKKHIAAYMAKEKLKAHGIRVAES